LPSSDGDRSLIAAKGERRISLSILVWIVAPLTVREQVTPSRSLAQVLAKGKECDGYEFEMLLGKW
jgi:hypothetical protein